jgi:hypothetical protein
MDNARSPHTNALPDFRKAEIPPQKLVAYLLDPLHKEGRHKARVFKSALGFEHSNADDLEKLYLLSYPIILQYWFRRGFGVQNIRSICQ